MGHDGEAALRVCAPARAAGELNFCYVPIFFLLPHSFTVPIK